MPKFGAHILIAELARQDRHELFEPLNLNALRLGAIGPDLTLFLFDPVQNPLVRKGYAILMDCLAELSKVRNELNRIAAIFDGPPNDLLNWATGSLYGDLKACANTALETLLNTLKLGVTRQLGSLNFNNPLFGLVTADGDIVPADFIEKLENRGPQLIVDATDNYGFPFRYFGHPYTDDGQWKQPYLDGYTRWWWMDMLHYRKTGTFARALLDRASTIAQISYARGYMTHVAGDICGHPFINAIVGGPFRNHAYRHIVLESLADTWLWDLQGRGDILDSRLDNLVRLKSSELGEVAALIAETMRAVYPAPSIPDLLPGRYPSTTELRAAYTAMTNYLELSTGGTVRRPDPPPDSVKELLDEMQKLLGKNRPGSPPAYTGDPLNFLAALLGWVLKGLVFIAMLATLPAALVQRFLQLGPRWLLYFIHQAIFMVYSGTRTILALTGWSYAGSEDFATFPFLRGLITADGAGDFGGYPRMTLPIKPPYYWLLPPGAVAPVEPNPTRVGPIRARATPAWLLDRANVPDIDFLRRFRDAMTPADTVQLETEMLVSGSPGFGNAVDCSIGFLDGSLQVADFDLDGDRGYGYRPWEELPPAERYL